MKKIVPFRGNAAEILKLPGKLTAISWELPKGLSFDEWARCGLALTSIEGAVQWWIGDWWTFGEHKYGERKAATEEGGILENLDFGTVRNYGWVASTIETSYRNDVLSFTHHMVVAPLQTQRERTKWLNLAVRDGLSVGKLRAAIQQHAAIARTKAVDFEAEKLGEFAVLYADPPWRYENPPMGGTNRSIENQYPTMTLEEICALPVDEIAHEHAVLFLWATAPKLPECMSVVSAWGFECRTNAVWDKVDIGMGYHFRNQHEILLVCKRGELAPPKPGTQPSSVYREKVGEHSAKPHYYYDMIDGMYPDIRKIELFGRGSLNRPLWTVWGNQAEQEAAE